MHNCLIISTIFSTQNSASGKQEKEYWMHILINEAEAEPEKLEINTRNRDAQIQKLQWWTAD